jgi:hypothetical protein
MTEESVWWPRVQLVELEDLPWFPTLLRDAGTAYIALAGRAAGHAALLIPKVDEALERSGKDRLLDLCAGGGGPLPVVVEGLRASGRDVTAQVSDLYPNVDALQRVADASGGAITARLTPVNATAVPDDLDGLRVIFNAFHHFPPEVARQVLGDAVRAGQPIAVFEILSREPLPLVGLLLSPLTFALSLPFLRPFRLAWVPLTFLVPVLPAFVIWDGIVSWLRIYGVGELQRLVKSLDAPGWTWDIGRIRLGGAPAHATYLVGYPPEA